MLSDIEKKIIAEIQGDIPVSERPYGELAKRLGISEEAFLQNLKRLNDKGIIRRFGATIRHQKSGFESNAMAAWKVDEERVKAVGEMMASFSEVSHCYRRNPTDEWPYNLYTMVHAKDEVSCRLTVQKMAEAASVETYTVLFSQRELKKTSMAYFGSEERG